MNSEFDDKYTSYQTDRSTVRKAVRKFYLRSAASQLRGPTLDFGCGVGELLERLPAGSKGVEYNQASVDYCLSRGLDVRWYDGFKDDWRMSTLPAEWRFESMVISHVLEHFESPLQVLRGLLAGASDHGISRVLVIVPGKAGFAIDPTHKCFVDIEAIRSAGVATLGWRIQKHRYFPLDLAQLGDHFAHHELQILLKRP